jgi:hypothetical protein
MKWLIRIIGTPAPGGPRGGAPRRRDRQRGNDEIAPAGGQREGRGKPPLPVQDQKRDADEAGEMKEHHRPGIQGQ